MKSIIVKSPKYVISSPTPPYEKSTELSSGASSGCRMKAISWVNSNVYSMKWSPNREIHDIIRRKGKMVKSVEYLLDLVEIMTPLFVIKFSWLRLRRGI